MIDYEFAFAPFGVTPDPKMIYSHKRFVEAADALADGVLRGKGFVVISGDVGAGKTTLLRTVLEEERKNLTTAVILNTGLGPDDLLRAILVDLGIEVGPTQSREELIELLNGFLIRNYAEGKITALFVDEAQNLSLEALEVLRMLSNLETHTDKLLQIVLFGQNELREILNDPRMEQLRSRVVVHRHLRPLNREETTEYVLHRIRIAQPIQPLRITAAALNEIHIASRGVPRLINIVASKALELAAHENLHEITAKHIKAAKAERNDLTIPGSGGAPGSWRQNLPAAAAWLILILSLGGIYAIVRPQGMEMTLPAALAASEQNETAQASRIAPDQLKLLELLFSAYGTRLADHRRDDLTPETLASQAGFRWTAVFAESSRLRGVGLPAIATLRTSAGDRSAVLIPDIPATDVVDVRVGNDHWRVRWEELDIRRDRPAAFLVPRAAPEGCLFQGDHGPEVVFLQNALARRGIYIGAISGRLDLRTVRAIREFQKQRGLPADGIAGPLTIGALAQAEGFPESSAS